MARYRQAVIAFRRLYDDYVATRYYLPILALLVLIQQFFRYAPFPARHYFYSDPATFMYGGNLLLRGYSPYLYLWDVKPPAIYDTTALIAALAPNDVMLQYYLTSFLTSLMAGVTVLLAAELVYRATQNDIAALATGFTIFAYPHFLTFPGIGIWSKYYALAFGFAAIYLVHNDRHLFAAISGALAAGYWQFAVVFPVIVLLDAYRTQTVQLWQPVTAMIGTTAVVTAPIILLGGGEAMLSQVVFSPFQMSDQSAGLIDRIKKFKGIVPYSWPLFYAACLTTVYHVVRDWQEAWWLSLGLGWAALQIGHLDFDAAPDPFMFVVFASIGLGLFIGRLDRRQQIGVTLALCTLTTGQLFDLRERFTDDPKTELNMRKPQVSQFVAGQYPPSTCLVSFGGVSLDRRNTDESLPQRCTPPNTSPFH